MDIMHGMRAWAETQPPRERIPSMIFLEEDQVWLPQQPTSSALDKRTLRELQALFFRSARDGRRRGIGLVLVAHRIAGIHKEVLMCDWLILHQPQATDLKRYCELAPTVHRERFCRLSRGRAIVVSPRGTQEVAFHRARSQDQGATPDLPALRRYRERASKRASYEADEFPLVRPMSTAAQPPVPRLLVEAPRPDGMEPEAGETIHLPQGVQPPSDLTPETGQGAEHTPVSQSGAGVPTGRFTSTLSPELRRALETWQHGHQSVDKLKDALGITHHKAYRLYRDLKARHLIA